MCFYFIMRDIVRRNTCSFTVDSIFHSHGNSFLSGEPENSFTEF
uniref:Uncharacterized protein n=1 Tax=Arundo donax TaxID=35708 RepID=A0A0A9BAA2_ARUDO